MMQETFAEFYPSVGKQAETRRDSDSTWYPRDHKKKFATVATRRPRPLQIEMLVLSASAVCILTGLGK